MKVAVIGGGPGGLMTARLLEQKSGGACRVTLFEGSSRLGGKIQTRRFSAAPATYEAGVAECYDYEAFGRDRLKDLIRDLGLNPVPTGSSTVALNGIITRDDHEIATHFGRRTLAALEQFRRDAARMVPAASWYRGFDTDDNHHPWARRSCEDLLDDVEDPIARQYLQTLIHSDMATEPHLTNGLIGLRNILKNVPGYGAQYTIEGGMERLPRRLAAQLTTTDVRLNATVAGVSRRDDGRYSVDVRHDRRLVRSEDFEAVVVALPYNQLRNVEWAGDRLRRAMTRHIAHYDRPGHFLRMSVLFDAPFWRRAMTGSWMMLDAFGGCCVYDEGSGSDTSGHGVLGWLLAGSDALALCNEDDRTLVARAIASLPDALRAEARRHIVESRVHRWAGALSGTPGGFPLRDPRAAHRPEPVEHEHLTVVGDYLFDSTLNGVLRSAEIATDVLLQRFPQEQSRLVPIAADGAVGDAEGLRDLGVGHAGEVTQLYHLRKPDVETGDVVERLVHAENLVLGTHRSRDEVLGQREASQITSAAVRLAATREVDDDGTHHASGPSHEVDAVLKSKPSGGCEPEVGLVHERGGVERGMPAGGMQAPARQLSEVVVRGGEERVGRTGVASLCTMNQFREAGAIGHDHQGTAPIMVQHEARLKLFGLSTYNVVI
jgi:monoamine oxidase